MTWLLAIAALAQDGPAVPQVNAQNYRPPMDARRTLWTESTGGIVDPHGEARVALHYMNRPFVWVPDDPEAAEMAVLVSDNLQMDVMGTVHAHRLRLGVSLPLYLYQAGQLSTDGAGLGDIRLDGRVTFADRDRAPFGAAGLLALSVPSATVDAPLGSRQPLLDMGAALDGEIGPVLVGANVLSRVGPERAVGDVNLDDLFLYRLGAGWSVSESTGISFDLAGQLAYSMPLANPSGSPLEGMLGAWGRVSESVVLRGGLGRGLTGGIGSPSLRAVSMFSFEPDKAPDSDGDGLADERDDCPLQREDFDRYQDLDGCPDRSQLVRFMVQTSAGFGLAEAESLVTGVDLEKGGDADFAMELHDGDYQLAANAKDFHDGRVAFSVPLPGEPTVVVLLEPAIALGALSVTVTGADNRPLDDVRWFVDGEPAPDLEDGVGSMPLPPGSYLVTVEASGYAPFRGQLAVRERVRTEEVVVLSPSGVVLTENEIVLGNPVEFESGSEVLLEQGYASLDEVATLLLQHPEVSLLRIEGSGDAPGDAKLAEERASVVALYLMRKGVRPYRLRSAASDEAAPGRGGASGHIRLVIERRSSR